MQGYYAGFDIGRTFHVLVVVDDLGKRVFKRQVANTFNTVQEAINRVQSIASGCEVYWAVEMIDHNARMLVETLVGLGKKVYQTTPYRLKRFKEAGAQPRKTDAIDAAALANLLRLLCRVRGGGCRRSERVRSTIAGDCHRLLPRFDGQLAGL